MVYWLIKWINELPSNLNVVDFLMLKKLKIIWYITEQLQQKGYFKLMYNKKFSFYDSSSSLEKATTSGVSVFNFCAYNSDYDFFISHMMENLLGNADLENFEGMYWFFDEFEKDINLENWTQIWKATKEKLYELKLILFLSQKDFVNQQQEIYFLLNFVPLKLLFVQQKMIFQQNQEISATINSLVIKLQHPFLIADEIKKVNYQKIVFKYLSAATKEKYQKLLQNHVKLKKIAQKTNFTQKTLQTIPEV